MTGIPASRARALSAATRAAARTAGASRRRPPWNSRSLIQSINSSATGHASGAKPCRSAFFAGGIESSPAFASARFVPQVEARAAIMLGTRRIPTPMGLIRTMLRELLARRGRGKVTFEEALALVNEERLVEAEAALREICIARPDDFNPRLWLGRVLYRQKKHGPASAVLGQALDCDPESTDARYLLGRALTDNGEYPGAVEALRRVVARTPAWGHGWLALADALKGAG